jgi:hypothetical protein
VVEPRSHLRRSELNGLLADDHPVEIARRLFDALNTEEVEQARDLHAQLGERLGVDPERVRYRKTLEWLCDEIDVAVDECDINRAAEARNSARCELAGGS